ncbi:MAG: helical backbone metal receptor [Endomicrobia bacterium]|nr:helical backbone metal receptor [Endomicrobiia bacterium]
MKFLFFVFFLIPIFSQEKIVSLTPSITETLYVLGSSKNVVGITSFCKRVSDSQKVVGSYLDYNIEEIVKLEPDLIFISKEGTKKETVDVLIKFRQTVVVLEPVDNYFEIKQQFLKIAKYLKKEEYAKKILKNYENKLKLTKNKNKISVVCLLSLQPLVAASDSSYIGDIIYYVGADNVIKTKIKYPTITLEELINLNPDFVLVADMGVSYKEIYSFFKPYPQLKFVKDKTIYVVPSDILCQPNIKNFFKSIEIIKNLIYEKKEF